MAFSTRALAGLPSLPRAQLRCRLEQCVTGQSRSMSCQAASSSKRMRSTYPQTTSFLSSHIRPHPRAGSQSHVPGTTRSLSVWPAWQRTTDPRAGGAEAVGPRAEQTAPSSVAAGTGLGGQAIAEVGPDVKTTGVNTPGQAISEHVAPTQTPDLLSTPSESPIHNSGSNATTTTPLVSPPSTSADLLPQPPALASSPTLDDLIALNPDNIQEVLNSSEAVHAVMRLGDLKLMGLEKGMLNPVGWIQTWLELVHVSTGMPWWATIVSFTILVRLCLLPLVIKGQRNNVQMAAIQPQTQALTQKMAEAKQVGDTVAMSVYSRQLQTLFKENNCGPFKSLLLPLVQMPIFLSFFFAVRGLATLPVPQLKEGGLWWFEDLTMADPYWVLPVVSMALQLAVLEVGADGTGGAAGQTRQTQHFKNVFRFMILLAIPFIGRIASAMTFYWTFTNAFTLLQATLLKRPTIRSILNIPTPRRAPTPQGVKPQPPPTMMETIREGRAYFRKTSLEAATKAAARAQANKAARGSGANRPIPAVVRSNPALEQSEVILESEPKAVVTAKATSAMTSTAVKGSPVLRAVASQKSEKEQRIAAARARREKRA